MKQTWGGAALALTLMGTVGSADADGRGRGDPEVIVEWNQILQQVVPAGGLAPPRHYAMLHVAMFDAINSVDRAYRPYRLQVRAAPGASAELAAAQAARDVLTAQFPTAQATFDAALEQRIRSIHPWQVRASTQVGKSVAAAILAWRQDDGWTATPQPYELPQLPGLYQRTAPNFGPPLFRQFADTRPFALITTTQYLPAPPPSVTSERYAESFDEVKQIGSKTSPTRTSEQTQLARLFANETSSTVHWALWNQVARDTARAQRLSLIETARLFALLNVAIHDGVQTSHTSKYIYGGWRPITAVQQADDDLNPQTTGDLSWTPLLITPPYPSHAGNMACVGASAARTLELVHDTDAMTFTAKWVGSNGHPDVARPYTTFKQLAEDQANSRIYGGIHFRFESEASQASCPKVAEYIYANFMKPISRHH